MNQETLTLVKKRNRFVEYFYFSGDLTKRIRLLMAIIWIANSLIILVLPESWIKNNLLILVFIELVSSIVPQVGFIMERGIVRPEVFAFGYSLFWVTWCIYFVLLVYYHPRYYYDELENKLKNKVISKKRYYLVYLVGLAFCIGLIYKYPNMDLSYTNVRPTARYGWLELVTRNELIMVSLGQPLVIGFYLFFIKTSTLYFYKIKSFVIKQKEVQNV